MKHGILAFVKRGFPVGGFGPVVYAIVMGILGSCGVVSAVLPQKLLLGILTSYLLAFVAGGITFVYEVERLPVFWAALIHGVVLYTDYLVIYLVNGWLRSGYVPMLIFTAAFVLGYLVIWAVIWGVTSHQTKRLNAALDQA